MKNIFLFLLMVFIFSNCKEKKDFQFEKVYGNINEETITEYNLINGKNYNIGKVVLKNKYSESKIISSERSDFINGNLVNEQRDEYVYNSDNFLEKHLWFFKDKKKWKLFKIENFNNGESENVIGIDSLLIFNYPSNFYKEPQKATNIYSINEDGLIFKNKRFVKNPQNPKDSTLEYEDIRKFNKKGFVVETKYSKFEKKISRVIKIEDVTKIQYNEFDEIGNWTKKTIKTNNNNLSTIFIRKITYK